MPGWLDVRRIEKIELSRAQKPAGERDAAYSGAGAV
jgi:hypothetical protein